MLVPLPAFWQNRLRGWEFIFQKLRTPVRCLLSVFWNGFIPMRVNAWAHFLSDVNQTCKCALRFFSPERAQCNSALVQNYYCVNFARLPEGARHFSKEKCLSALIRFLIINISESRGHARTKIRVPVQDKSPLLSWSAWITGKEFLSRAKHGVCRRHPWLKFLSG